MKSRLKRPKRRIPLPKKTEKVIPDSTVYSRKKKHRKKANVELP
jgi:hypothetical protein